MGPNIRFVAGEYWDFWDHHLPLTERSLSEACQLRGFTMAKVVDRSELHVLNHAGHFVFAEHPVEVTRLINEALAQSRPPEDAAPAEPGTAAEESEEG